MAEADTSYVSRGGLKLAAALDQFAINPSGWFCVDLGCNVGGFTDCLLQRGARHVIAVDTGYGALAWKLRNDPRVTVAERTNAMHVEVTPLLEEAAAHTQPVNPVDLVVLDLGWTPQLHAIPAAMRWEPRAILSLIKPHYELTEGQRRATSRSKGKVVLTAEQSREVAERVCQGLPELGVTVVDWMESPVVGGSGKGHQGNREYLAWLRPV